MSNSNVLTISVDADEFSAYIEDDLKLGKRIGINVGAHFASFAVEDVNYIFLQPRFAINVNTSPDISIKASYSNMAQYIHLLSSNSVGLPTDLWVPSTAKIKPGQSHQVALGLTRSLSKSFELTIEGFYKELKSVIEYRSGQDPYSSSENW